MAKETITTVEELDKAIAEEEGVEIAEDPKYVKYFEKITPEDKDDVLNICELSSKIISEKFRMSFVNPTTKRSDPRYVGVVFNVTFEVILDLLKSLIESDKLTHFELNLMDRLEIGFSDSDDDEDEKTGNYMIYINAKSSNKKTDIEADPTMKGRELVIRWASENVVQQPERIKQICNLTAKRLSDDYDINLATSECVALIFTLVYESCVNYLKIKRREDDLYEKEINFLSCFSISARETEDSDTDEISIRPSLKGKRFLKNDESATASKDDE